MADSYYVSYDYIFHVNKGKSIIYDFHLQHKGSPFVNLSHSTSRIIAEICTVITNYRDETTTLKLDRGDRSPIPGMYACFLRDDLRSAERPRVEGIPYYVTINSEVFSLTTRYFARYSLLFPFSLF